MNKKAESKKYVLLIKVNALEKATVTAETFDTPNQAVEFAKNDYREKGKVAYTEQGMVEAIKTLESELGKGIDALRIGACFCELPTTLQSVKDNSVLYCLVESTYHATEGIVVLKVIDNNDDDEPDNLFFHGTATAINFVKNHLRKRYDTCTDEMLKTKMSHAEAMLERLGVWNDGNMVYQLVNANYQD